jgi:hypothetical protein
MAESIGILYQRIIVCVIPGYDPVFQEGHIDDLSQL